MWDAQATGLPGLWAEHDGPELPCEEGWGRLSEMEVVKLSNMEEDPLH